MSRTGRNRSVGPDRPEGPRGPGRGGRGRGGGGGRGGDDDGRGRRRSSDDDEPVKKSWKRFIPSWKILMAGSAVIAAGVFGMIAIAYANTTLPTEKDYQESAVAQGSVFQYAGGKQFAKIGTKRTIVKIADVPKHVQDAVIAAENDSFRQDVGISIPSIARSVWMTVTGQQLQGGSTITQQMARNYFEGLSREVAIKRKIKEIFVAIKLDREWDKDKILEYYLNTIPFGRNTYGIEAAARDFFRKGVKDLTIAEGMYLAGRIQRPGDFDRYESQGKYAATMERFEYVRGQISKVDPAYASQVASLKFPKPKKRRIAEEYAGSEGYMLNIVQRELEKDYGITKEELQSGGYIVKTSFDPAVMAAAKRAVESRTQVFDATVHTSLAAVDPRNGRVAGFYSGRDFLRDYNNRAFDAAKQAASAFKPYVLAAWLNSDRSLSSLISGKSPYQAKGTSRIANAGGTSFGTIDLVKATAQSVNTVFVQMGEKVGLDAVAEIAKKAGVGERAKATLKENSVDWAIKNHGYATTIGSATVTAVEQANGYGIFANGGKHFDWHTVVEVKQRDRDTGGNRLVFKERLNSVDVISPDAAADATYAMTQVVRGGTGGAANLGARPVAGKTGTNNESKDAWFVGFAPQLSAAVGMYREVPADAKTGKRLPYNPKTGRPLKRKKNYVMVEEPLPGAIGGGGVPTQIWHDFMAEALKNADIEQFPPRADAGTPDNMAPVPPPSPTPDPDEPMEPDDPNGEDGWPVEEDPTQQDPPQEDGYPDDSGCAENDLFCDANAQPEGSGTARNGDGSGDRERSPSGQMMPSTGPSGRSGGDR
ncbi:carboxypeptidase [Spongiactinospora rosea]|uniref:Carboxypeptidase n=1 Tax=Spongiactinospora rosea TaxID=2248750 RepID=A0A366LPK0_9ACTN|nr:transglycosylase domain-containing protein [Spongiactinospora rosea]RBQ15757.1 carboxypeptidase [Spongiactinospora rosea]